MYINGILVLKEAKQYVKELSDIYLYILLAQEDMTQSMI